MSLSLGDLIDERVAGLDPVNRAAAVKLPEIYVVSLTRLKTAS